VCSSGVEQGGLAWLSAFQAGQHASSKHLAGSWMPYVWSHVCSRCGSIRLFRGDAAGTTRVATCHVLHLAARIYHAAAAAAAATAATATQHKRPQ
jgi:hypothetical protein